MNYGRNENPTYHIFIHLGASVSFSTQRIVWKNLTRNVTVKYFLDALKLQRNSECTTQEP